MFANCQSLLLSEAIALRRGHDGIGLVGFWTLDGRRVRVSSIVRGRAICWDEDDGGKDGVEEPHIVAVGDLVVRTPWPTRRAFLADRILRTKRRGF